VKKIITFEVKEFDELLLNFAKNLMEYGEKGYGCSLVYNETNKKPKSIGELGAALMLPWNKTFKESS
jgi:hypothetical protein